MTYRWPGISGREDSLRLLNLVIVLSIRARRVSAIAGTPSSRLDSDTDGSSSVRLDSGEACPCSRWDGIGSDSQGLTFFVSAGEREVTDIGRMLTDTDGLERGLIGARSAFSSCRTAAMARCSCSSRQMVRGNLHLFPVGNSRRGGFRFASF